jgi:hypothetical protein
MSEGNDLDFDFGFSVYHNVRKTTQRQASRTAFRRHPRDRRAKTRMPFDQIQSVFDLSEEFVAESGLFIFVPRNNRPEFIPSCVLNPDRFAHLRRISALIWRRTSSHAVVPVVPASKAAHRRSISAAHAASTSAASRLRPARSTGLRFPRVLLEGPASCGLGFLANAL